MTLSAVRIVLAALAGVGFAHSAMAQNSDLHRRQPVQAQWEQMPAKSLLCVDARLRRTRQSVNRLIDRGVGPSDTRLARIVGECGAETPPSADTATPSFDCLAATHADEKTICDNPELARLDRAVVQAYKDVLARRGSRVAKNISEPLLEQRHACGADSVCIKQTQLAAIGAFQERGASLPAPSASADNGRSEPGYAIDDVRLGSVVAGNSRLSDFDCTPSRQYTNLTACRRQSTERSRRRRTSVSTSLLHAADGSVVYIGQSLEPVYIGDEEAEDEIARLSASFGKASLLPMSGARGRRNGIIASWGAVTLRPVEPDGLASLAAGAEDPSGLLIDHLGNPQKSAKSGLAVYRLEGGPGYVWIANWGRRGRGALRMVAIDASQLSAAQSPDAETTSPTAVAVTSAAGPQDGAAAPAAPTQTSSTPIAPAPTLPAEHAPATAPQSDPPVNVRVVGPPIDLRPSSAPNTATPPATPSPSRDGISSVMFLAAVIVLLLGIVVYIFSRSRAGTVVHLSTKAPDASTASKLPASPMTVGTHGADRIDLTALVPAISPDSIAASSADMSGPPALGVATDIRKRSAA